VEQLDEVVVGGNTVPEANKHLMFNELALGVQISLGCL